MPPRGASTGKGGNQPGRRAWAWDRAPELLDRPPCRPSPVWAAPGQRGVLGSPGLTRAPRRHRRAAATATAAGRAGPALPWRAEQRGKGLRGEASGSSQARPTPAGPGGGSECPGLVPSPSHVRRCEQHCGRERDAGKGGRSGCAMRASHVTSLGPFPPLGTRPLRIAVLSLSLGWSPLTSRTPRFLIRSLIAIPGPWPALPSLRPLRTPTHPSQPHSGITPQEAFQAASLQPAPHSPRTILSPRSHSRESAAASPFSGAAPPCVNAQHRGSAAPPFPSQSPEAQCAPWSPERAALLVTSLRRTVRVPWRHRHWGPPCEQPPTPPGAGSGRCWRQPSGWPCQCARGLRAARGWRGRESRLRSPSAGVWGGGRTLVRNEGELGEKRVSPSSWRG